MATRTRARARALAIAAPLMTAAALVPSPALATYGSSTDLILEHVVMTPVTVSLKHTSNGVTPTVTITAASATDSPTDANGRLMAGSSIPATSAVDKGTLQGTTSFPCVNNRSNASFSVGNRITKAFSGAKFQYRWQFQAYVQRNARVIAGVAQTQVEWCATGGFDGQGGNRSFYNGSIVTVRDSNANRRIGLAYDSGNDKSTTSSSLAISYSAGPVTISGSMATNGTGNLYGGYGVAKYSSPADAWSSNESYGAWRSGCTWRRDCGSPDMQNQIHHSLFEYPSSVTNSSYVLDDQANYYCAGPYGKGCS